VDLPGQLALDLVHCERAADAVVAAGIGGITLAQGELFSAAYFDGLAAEVDEGLQEAGVVSGAGQNVCTALRVRRNSHPVFSDGSCEGGQQLGQQSVEMR
jgi:sugar phosphate isomerase/epimerase